MLIQLTKIKKHAHADTNSREWIGGADAREILVPMATEEVYVDPKEIVYIEDKAVRTGWDESKIPRPCRAVGEYAPWWVLERGSYVYIKPIGWYTFLESKEVVAGMVNNALSLLGPG